MCSWKYKRGKVQSEVASHRIAWDKEYDSFISSTNIYNIPTQLKALLFGTGKSESKMTGTAPAALEIMFWGGRAITQLIAQLVVDLYLQWVLKKRPVRSYRSYQA